MTSPDLPEPLAALLANYRRLHDAAAEGHVSPADALAALTAAVVLDASGAVWSVDPYGVLLRAPGHGMPATCADPSDWISSPPVIEPVGPLPLVAPLPGPVAVDDVFSNPPRSTDPGPYPAAHDARYETPDGTSYGVPQYGAQAGEPGSQAVRARRASRRASRRAATSVHSASPAVRSLLRRLLAGNTALLSILCLAGALALVLAPHHDTRSAVPVPSVTNTALPTDADIRATTAALLSGSPAGISAHLATPAPDAAAAAARTLGSLARAGAYIQPSPATRTSTGATQSWYVRAADGRTLATLPVTWVNASGRWLLRALPDLAALHR